MKDKDIVSKKTSKILNCITKVYNDYAKQKKLRTELIVVIRLTATARVAVAIFVFAAPVLLVF